MAADREDSRESTQRAECTLYTVQEASARLNVPETWLYERTRRNAVPCHRFGKYVRFTQSDLEEIIAAGAVKPGV